MVSGALKSNKNSNKCLEEAQASGVLHISNKVLRDIYQLDSDEFDLMDVQDADLSLNSLQDVPTCMSDWFSLNKLSLARNGIREIPNFFVNFSLLHTLDMKSLFFLDISRNQLEQLPESICKLKLIHFDASTNKICMIPLCYQKISTLKTFNVSENPLKIPSLHVLKYGRIHFLKLLKLKFQNLNQTCRQEV